MTAAAGADLTPTEVRLRVLKNGWRPLPVAGKAPTATDWSRYCRAAPTDGEVTFWGRSHPGAASTGLAMGAEVAIDIDVLSDPDRAEAVRGIAMEVFGRTPFERVGRAPKTALLYRAGPDVVSVHRKAADGSDDGVDILADGCQVVGFGLHKDTRQPYAWTGESSPLDAGPGAAPVITGAQIDTFLTRVGAVMPLHGGGGARTGGTGGKGSSEEIVRGSSGLVVNGRERFLMNCVWRAANALHQVQEEITLAAVTEGAWALFSDPERGAELNDGKWTRADAAYKAKITLRRIQAGTVDLSDSDAEEGSADPVPPTYPDISVTVAEARAAVDAAMAAHFAAGTGQRALRISTGTGKTRAAVKAVVADVRRRRGEGDKSSTLYLTPTLALADEVAELFRAEGVTARTFRGRGATDPDAEGLRMCHDLEAVELALKLDLTVSTACCRLKDRDTGVIYHCPSYGSCSYQRQVTETPDIWLASHDMLWTAPGGLGEVGSLVVDEGFAQGGIKIAKRGMTLEEVGTQPAPGHNNFEMMDHADIAAWRSTLKAALQRQGNTGGVERRHLVEAGLTAETCTKAGVLEWRLFDAVAFWPGMGKEARETAAKAAQARGRIGKITSVWRAARGLLEQEDEGAVSGRLVLTEVGTEDGFGKARAVLTHGVKPVLKRWLGIPVLLLDATLPPVGVLRQFFPEVEIVADVESTAPFATVRQVLGAPTSKGKLHGAKSDAGGVEEKVKRALQAVRRAILLRWVRAGRVPTLVTAQKDTAAALRELGMPDGITLGHYGALAGLDGFKGVGLLIAIGRAMPDPLKVETMAGAMTGLEPLRAARPDKGMFFHDRVPLALRMADGTGRAVEGYRHPDPVAEAFRWQSAEGGVLQAIGRARAVNRSAADPVSIEVWSDLALPLTIDEVVRWDDVPAGYEADMAVDGIALESVRDLTACWPTVWGTERAAEHWRARVTDPQTPIRDVLYRGLGVCGASEPQPPRPAPFRYKHPGARQKWRLGWYLPDVVADPFAWLEARLGLTLAGAEYLPDDQTESERPEAGETADHHQDERDAA